MEYLSVFSPNAEKHGPAKTPYLDTFLAVYGKKSSFKYFIGHIDDDDIIRPLRIKINQMIGYVKCFNSNMSFKDNNKNKYTKTWEKVGNLMDIELHSESVYGDNDKCIKIKIKTWR